MSSDKRALLGAVGFLKRFLGAIFFPSGLEMFDHEKVMWHKSEELILPTQLNRTNTKCTICWSANVRATCPHVCFLAFKFELSPNVLLVVRSPPFLSHHFMQPFPATLYNAQHRKDEAHHFIPEVLWARRSQSGDC